MLTDKQTIKTLLQIQSVAVPDQFDAELKLSAYDAGQLPHANIIENSDVVKIIQAAAYTEVKNPLTLNTAIAIPLTYQKILKGSFFAENAVTLAPLIENYDYVVDYYSGTIMLATPNGSIPSGTTVNAYYTPFTVMTRSDDYSIEISSGIITRRAGTRIPDQAVVYVDYAISGQSVSDASIDQAITQAEAYIQSILSVNYSTYSSSEHLKSAATFFAMELIALSQAFRELSEARDSESDARAKQWQSLSEKFADTARLHVSKFASVLNLSVGGVLQNRFSGSRTHQIESPSIPLSRRRK